MDIFDIIGGIVVLAAMVGGYGYLLHHSIYKRKTPSDS